MLVLPYLLVLTVALQGSEGNLALGKNATQKSTMRHWHGYSQKYFNNSAGRAVDGQIHTNDPEEGCASTANSADMDAWWMVDLARVYVITKVTIYNRRGSYHRLRDFWIRVGNSSNITQHVDCAYKSGWIDQGGSETFRCDGTLSGRWVSIQRTNDYGYYDPRKEGFLHLCEVQVYGYTALATTPDALTSHGRSTVEFPAASHQTKILTYKTTQQSVTTYTRQKTTSGPEMTQAKVYGWPVPAVVTSVVLGILLLTVVTVYVIFKVRKTYTVSCIRKEAIGRKESAPVPTGSVEMTGLGHGEDYEPVQAAGTQNHSAGNYEQVDIQHQSRKEEEKKYETLNSEQMTSQEPKTYERLGK